MGDATASTSSERRLRRSGRTARATTTTCRTTSCTSSPRPGSGSTAECSATSQAGNAKIFQPVDRALVARMWRRKRMHKYVLPEGARSEVLAGLLEQAWKARRREGLPRGERGRLAAGGVDEAKVRALAPKLDEVAARWRSLAPGESITLEWPRPEGRKHHARRRRRRPAKPSSTAR